MSEKFWRKLEKKYKKSFSNGTTNELPKLEELDNDKEEKEREKDF